MKLRGKLGALLLLVMVVAVACGGDDAGSGSEDTGSTEAEAPEAGGSGTLAAANFAFDPADLTAAVGDQIEFTNEDDAKHNFTAEDAGIDVDVDAKGSATIDLADVEPGSYDFFCEYHCDTMKGTLEVTE